MLDTKSKDFTGLKAELWDDCLSTGKSMEPWNSKAGFHKAHPRNVSNVDHVSIK
jgi:hypothetical protein